jgi:hypothetical protein
MVVLATIAAVIATVMLVISAISSAAQVTAADRESRGPWGIMTRVSLRNRPLDPHERRWQTALLSARTNPSRWRDLRDEIARLERSAGIAPHSAPETFNAGWLEAHLRDLEAAAGDQPL